MLLGAIADDFTGATDLANMRVRGGMRTMRLPNVAGLRIGLRIDPGVPCTKTPGGLHSKYPTPRGIHK